MDVSPPPIVLVLILIFAVVLAVARRYQVRQRRASRKPGVVPLATFASQQLRWTEIAGGTREFELMADDQLIATLSFRPTWGVRQHFATGECADGCWTFKSDWLGNVTISECGTNKEIGRFTIDERETGVVQVADGRKFHFMNNATWISAPSAREFQDESGQSLIQQNIARGWTRRGAITVIQARAAHIAELPWLVMLAWYLPMARASDSVN